MMFINAFNFLGYYMCDITMAIFLHSPILKVMHGSNHARSLLVSISRTVIHV